MDLVRHGERIRTAVSPGGGRGSGTLAGQAHRERRTRGTGTQREGQVGLGIVPPRLAGHRPAIPGGGRELRDLDPMLARELEEPALEALELARSW